MFVRTYVGRRITNNYGCFLGSDSNHYLFRSLLGSRQYNSKQESCAEGLCTEGWRFVMGSACSVPSPKLSKHV